MTNVVMIAGGAVALAAGAGILFHLYWRKPETPTFHTPAPEPEQRKCEPKWESRYSSLD